MQPQDNISIRRSYEDTDPIYISLFVSNNNVATAVANTANVTMILEDNTHISAVGVGSNGNFIVPFANVVQTWTSMEFSIKVEGDVTYIIGKGTINFVD